MASLGESDVTLMGLNKIIHKLVLDPSEKVNKKSYEYLRLLKIKQGAGLSNLSDSGAIVICLNLACDKLSFPFDKTLAIKVAGLNKKNYTNFYHTVEKVLGIDKPMTVPELCVKMTCSNVSDLAQQLLDRYVCEREHGPPVDLSHPMYTCAAVMAACKQRKVRIKRELLIEICRVKAKELDRLASELAALGEQTDKKASRKRAHHLIDMVEQMVKESPKIQTTSIENEEEDTDKKPQESFEDWKKRILAKAERS